MKMDDEDFQGIISGLNNVKDYVQGKREGFVVHQGVDVKAIRRAAHKTQRQFAETYHLPVGTVRDWEQNRSQPDAPARVLLSLIEREPKTIERIIAKVQA